MNEAHIWGADSNSAKFEFRKLYGEQMPEFSQLETRKKNSVTFLPTAGFLGTLEGL